MAEVKKPSFFYLQLFAQLICGKNRTILIFKNNFRINLSKAPQGAKPARSKGSILAQRARSAGYHTHLLWEGLPRFCRDAPPGGVSTVIGKLFLKININGFSEGNGFERWCGKGKERIFERR
jgi:hypothetical protein